MRPELQTCEVMPITSAKELTDSGHTDARIYPRPVCSAEGFRCQMDRLHLVRQEISHSLQLASHEQSAVKRCQRWHDCSAMSEVCTGLLCQVSDVQYQTFDEVFARQVLSIDSNAALYAVILFLCQRAVLLCS